MSEKPGNGKKHESHHPSVESPEAIERARSICDNVLMSVSEDDIEEGLLDVCRKMSLGQLAYTLLHLDQARHNFPPRDYAVATAFKEKYIAQAEEQTKH